MFPLVAAQDPFPQQCTGCPSSSSSPALTSRLGGNSRSHGDVVHLVVALIPTSLMISDAEPFLCAGWLSARLWKMSTKVPGPFSH